MMYIFTWGSSYTGISMYVNHFISECSQVNGELTPDLAGSFLQSWHITYPNSLNAVWHDSRTLLPPSVLNLLHLLLSIKKIFEQLSVQRSLTVSTFNLGSENFLTFRCPVLISKIGYKYNKLGLRCSLDILNIYLPIKKAIPRDSEESCL